MYNVHRDMYLFAYCFCRVSICFCILKDSNLMEINNKFLFLFFKGCWFEDDKI